MIYTLGVFLKCLSIIAELDGHLHAMEPVVDILGDSGTQGMKSEHRSFHFASR